MIFGVDVLERVSRHQVFMVSQTATTGGVTIFPYTHSNNHLAKNLITISPDNSITARFNKYSLLDIDTGKS